MLIAKIAPMKQLHYGGGALLVLWLGWMPRALAHGSTIQFRTTQAIEIQAHYDGGTPMSEAQVAVYAPSDPTTPWMQGVTDEEGRFTFTPDLEQPGYWDVKVRQAGHGSIASIPVGEAAETAIAAEDAAAAPAEAATAVAPAQWSGRDYTPLQKWTMAAAGIWGFVGTALFFTRRKG